jgi:hypothetical protein
MNAINVIFPYKYEDMWVFDNAPKGLQRELFVARADTVLDRMAELLGCPDAPLKLIFSPGPFPGNTLEARSVWPELNGNVYRIEEWDAEGWLCPALLRYVEAPQEKRDVQATPKRPVGN